MTTTTTTEENTTEETKTAAHKAATSAMVEDLDLVSYLAMLDEIATMRAALVSK
jgi:hypothetical protein